MSATWRTKFHEVMAAHVESRQMPGLAALVAVGDDVHVEIIGSKSFEDSATLQRDDIFRIASLTKPITAVAALMLIDDGVLRLDQAVDDLLPELADRRVLRSIGAGLDDTVPAKRSISVEDLLTTRLGFGCILAMPGTYPIQIAEEELQLHTISEPWPPPPLTNDEWIAALGTLPLMHQPGEDWMYNSGLQVLGVLIERAARRPLETFMRERVFEPLNMVDTAFSVPGAKLDRFTTAYAPDAVTGELRVLDPAKGGWWSSPPLMPNAAGWLVSTIDDYWSFVRLVLDGGVRDGQQLVSESLLREMVRDELTPRQRASAAPFVGEHSGWGYGLATVAAGDDGTGVPSGFGWDGGTGTSWRSDPARGLTGILLTQRGMTSPEPPQVAIDFWNAVYSTLP